MLCLAVAVAWPTAHAAKATKPSPENPRSLKEIGSARSAREDRHPAKDIAAAEGSRAEVADQLKDSERSISQLQRELRELGDERGQLQGTLRELGTQARSLEAQIAAQQAQLADLLYQQYLRGAPDSLQLLLNGDNPNQMARDMYYIDIIAQARINLLQQIEANLRRSRISPRALLGPRQRARRQRPGRRTSTTGCSRSARQKKATYSKISAQIAAQKKEVGALQRDERRLKDLIDKLTKLIAARTRRPTQAPREGGKAARPQAPPHWRSKTRSCRRRPRRQFRCTEGPSPFAGEGNRQQSLRRPAPGRQQLEGLFIRSQTGGEVKAVAGGRVVFAEWMRSFGNLLIVDHGDSYLTIYGNNDALLKHVGDSVRGGDTVATVGNSGGNPESGLYFEIRHQGQPVNP